MADTIKEYDWMALKIKAPVFCGVSMAPVRFDGEIKRVRIGTIGELRAAFNYGAYLCQNGYTFFPVGELNTITSRFGWYFSSVESWAHPHGASDAKYEVERAICISVHPGTMRKFGLGLEKVRDGFKLLRKATGLVRDGVGENFAKQAGLSKINHSDWGLWDAR